MGKRTANDKEKYNSDCHTKRTPSVHIIENNTLFGEDSKTRCNQRIKKQKKIRNISKACTQKLCINKFPNAHNGMVDFPSEYI